MGKLLRRSALLLLDQRQHPIYHNRGFVAPSGYESSVVLWTADLFGIPQTFIIVDAKVNSTVREAASTRVVMMGLAIRAVSR